jgi:hypothetical protein
MFEGEKFKITVHGVIYPDMNFLPHSIKISQLFKKILGEQKSAHLSF